MTMAVELMSGSDDGSIIGGGAGGLSPPAVSVESGKSSVGRGAKGAGGEGGGEDGGGGDGGGTAATGGQGGSGTGGGRGGGGGGGGGAAGPEYVYGAGGGGGGFTYRVQRKRHPIAMPGTLAPQLVTKRTVSEFHDPPSVSDTTVRSAASSAS
mmetsp:Transcript_32594/g.58357  ORF Transcript_32594/g.58357 Transcript_32594/m.58357 type:complete len:153 (-) Transcript_32594:494-952(-)